MKREDFTDLFKVLLKYWIFILLIIIYWIISFAIGEIECNSKNYILSSISQGLAALFALIFTVSLIIAQISEKYSSQALEYLYSKRFIFFAFLFTFGIFFPLIAMKLDSDLYVNFSIGIAGTCIILLIPFFLSFKDLIIVRLLLLRLSNKVTREMKEKRTLSEQINDIENILLIALKEKRYPLFNSGLISYFDIFVNVNDLRFMLDFLELSNNIFDQSIEDKRGRHIIIDSLRISGEHSVSSQSRFGNHLVCQCLSNKGKEGVNSQDDTIVREVTWSLMKIADKSIKKNWLLGFNRSLLEMKFLFEAAIENGTAEMKYWIIKYFNVLAYFICEEKNPLMLDSLIVILNEVDDLLIKKNRRDERESIIGLWRTMMENPASLSYDEGVGKIGITLIQLLKKSTTWDEVTLLTDIISRIIIPYLNEKNLKNLQNDYINALRVVYNNTKEDILHEMIKATLNDSIN